MSFYTLSYICFFTQPTASVIQEFMTMMAICHTAVPEHIDNKITYQAASPGQSNFSKHTETTNVHIESHYQYTTLQKVRSSDF